MTDDPMQAMERLLAIAEKNREDARQDALDAMRLHELERRRYDDLLEKYHALAVKALTPAPLVMPPIITTTTGNGPTEPEIEMPPAVVLAAMKRISPTPDKAYEANWRFWEANKEKAATHPDVFAEEILAGMNPS